MKTTSRAAFVRSAAPVALLLLLAACASGPPRPAPVAPVPVAQGAPVPAAPAPAEDPGPWRKRAEEEWRLGVAEAARGDGTSAELRLLDARESARRLVDLVPGDPDAWRLRGLVLRDSTLYAEAAAAFRRSLELSREPGGETFYDLGFCQAYAREFAAALDSFRRAEALLGATVDVAVNAAICEEHLGDRAGAVARLRRFYDAEVAAGRPRGADARRALDKTWDLTVGRRDFEAGKAALRSVSDAHATLPEAPYMLGNLHAFLGEHEPAADAYEEAGRRGGTPGALVREIRARAAAARAEPTTQRVAEAASSCRIALRRPPAEGLPEACRETARALLVAGFAASARDLLRIALEKFPADADLLLADGDAAMAGGDPAAALASYGAALEENPLSTEIEARAAGARLAVRRAGGTVAGEPGEFSADDAPVEPGEPGESIADFDDFTVFVSAEGSKEARISGGVMALGLAPAVVVPAVTPGAAPPGDPPPPGATPSPMPAARRAGRTRVPLGPLVRVEFFPLLDGRNWESLSFRARTSGGSAGLRVAILDGYDEAGSGFARSRWPAEGAPVAIGPRPTEVTVPLAALAGFVPTRPMAPLLQRVRAFLVQAEAGPEAPASHVILDDFVLHGPGGARRVLADFEETVEQVAVIYDGTIVPFERTLSTAEEVAAFTSPGTVVYAPHIVATGFDAARVGGGTASLRVHHGEAGSAPAGPWGRAAGVSEDGSASVRVTFRPDRDLSRFRALTFLARGEKGGERLRVRLVDAAARDLAAEIPAVRRPAALFPRTAAADGALVLPAAWRRFRVRFEDFPDIDRSVLASLVFELGDDAGNPRGTVLYLDSLGLE